jgi:hypothetical protein
MISITRSRDWSRGGCSHLAFYKVVGRRKASGHEEGGSGGGTSMAPITGDGNGKGEAMERGRFQRGRGGGGEVAPWC